MTHCWSSISFSISLGSYGVRRDMGNRRPHSHTCSCSCPYTWDVRTRSETSLATLRTPSRTRRARLRRVSKHKQLRKHVKSSPTVVPRPRILKKAMHPPESQSSAPPLPRGSHPSSLTLAMNPPTAMTLQLAEVNRRHRLHRLILAQFCLC
jgi:septal ring-binding cell division protein DamX